MKKDQTNKIEKEWLEMARDSSEDASTIDCIISDTSINDWNQVLSLLNQLNTIFFDTSGNRQNLPKTLDPVDFQSEGYSSLEVILNAQLRINFFLFELTEIEFSFILPKTYSQQDLGKIKEFIQQVGHTVGKEIRIHTEGMPKPTLCFSLEGGFSLA